MFSVPSSIYLIYLGHLMNLGYQSDWAISTVHRQWLPAKQVMASSPGLYIVLHKLLGIPSIPSAGNQCFQYPQAILLKYWLIMLFKDHSRWVLAYTHDQTEICYTYKMFLEVLINMVLKFVNTLQVCLQQLRKRAYAVQQRHTEENGFRLCSMRLFPNQKCSFHTQVDIFYWRNYE